MPARRSVVVPLVLAAVLAGACGTETAVPATTPPTPVTTSATAASSAPAAPAGQQVPLGYAGGEVVGDTRRVEVPLGSTVTLVVTGDTADEVHLHGYDRYVEVTPGASAMLTFTADIPGVFEVELHDAGLLLAQLEVS